MSNVRSSGLIRLPGGLDLRLRFPPAERLLPLITRQERRPDSMTSTAKPSSGLKILYGEGDTEALASNVAEMQKAGHQVTTAQGRKPVEEALRKGSFDFAVLGG